MKKLLISLLAVTMLSNCTGSADQPKTQTKIVVEKWYEGGSLHKADMARWKRATEKNQLATCGDFMGTVDNTVSMDVLKIRAEKLKSCINEATEGLENMDYKKLTLVATLCIKTMGY